MNIKMARNSAGHFLVEFSYLRRYRTVQRMMPVPSLQFDRVVKSYGTRIVLSEISFHLDAGEYLGLVGVNGAGKTTLIKSLLDFCAIDSGSIRIFGMDHRQAAARKRLTFLPEKFTPPYYLTGGDYLRYMAELNEVPYAEDKVHELLAILDLEHNALSRTVRHFSKGMGQKLGLVACLSSGRELIVFDEPMSGLDPRARAWFRQYLLDLREKGRTLFYSTHLLDDIEALCNKVAILHEGEMQFLGTPQECCRKYNTASLEQAYLACVDGGGGAVPGKSPWQSLAGKEPA